MIAHQGLTLRRPRVTLNIWSNACTARLGLNVHRDTSGRLSWGVFWHLLRVVVVGSAPIHLPQLVSHTFTSRPQVPKMLLMIVPLAVMMSLQPPAAHSLQSPAAHVHIRLVSFLVYSC